MTENILVTGAAGFLGQHLVERLIEEGHRVTALDIQYPDNLSYSDHIGDEVDYQRGSVLHTEFVDSVVFPTPDAYDRVFHLAAIVGVDRYIDVEDPLYIVNVNVNGTKNILDRVRGTDTQFTYVSTSEVYGRNPSVPWSEDDDRVLGPPTVSRWSYSETKSLCEQMIHMLADNGDLNASVVRPFNLYGPYQRPNFVIPKFIEMALSGESPTVYGDGTQQRCFTYVGDFIEGIIAASNRAPNAPRAYNLGSTDETEIVDLANEIIDTAGADVEPEFVDPEADLEGDYDQPDRRIPDVSRAEEHLDWKASTPLKSGIEKTVAEMRDRLSADA